MGLMERKVKLGGEWWRIIGVYVNGDMDKKLNRLREWMEDGEEGVRVLVGGDFNARTGTEGGWWEEDEDGDRRKVKRRSKDGKLNSEGKKLCGSLRELG